MIEPRVNLNGTAKAELIRQCLAVIDATHELRKALADAAPHSRDYQTYPNSTTIFNYACDTFKTLMSNVEEVERTYALMAEKLDAGA